MMLQVLYWPNLLKVGCVNQLSFAHVFRWPGIHIWQIKDPSLLSWWLKTSLVWFEHMGVGELGLRVSFHGGFPTHMSDSWVWGQAVNHSIHPWFFHIAWTSSQNGGCVPRESVLKRKQSERMSTRIIRRELHDLFWSSLRVTQHLFHFVLLVISK